MRRSPLEQYSMASRGRSLMAMEATSSGTSLAWTIFTWFSLLKKCNKTCCIPLASSKCVARIINSIYRQCIYTIRTSSWFESPCSSVLYSCHSDPSGKVSQQFSLLSPAPRAERGETDLHQDVILSRTTDGLFSTYIVLIQVDVPKATHPESFLHCPSNAYLALFQCRPLHGVQILQL